MDALVLKLAEITHSTFAQPLPSELAPVARRNLTIAIGGAEKQVSLAEAMAALDIPAASIALIDQDQIASHVPTAMAWLPTASFRRRLCRNS